MTTQMFAGALIGAVLFGAASGSAADDDAAPPVTLALIYQGEGWTNAVGGERRGSTYLHNIDLAADVDLNAAVGWPGASLFAYGLGNHGGSPSAYAGDVQALSNIDAPHAWRLYELWLRQDLIDGRLRFKAGLIDLNSEFDVITPVRSSSTAPTGSTPSTPRAVRPAPLSFL